MRPDRFAEFLFEHEFAESVRRFLWGAPPEDGGVRRMTIALWEKWIPNALPETEATVAGRERVFVHLAQVVLERATLPRERKLGVMTDTRQVEELINTLRLDGYDWADGRLRRNEENVFDVEEQAVALQRLWDRLGIGRGEQLRHDLRLADEHYEASRWGDCITHARHVVEVTFRQIAAERETRGFPPVPAGAERRPVVVRDHLRTTGFYDQQEQDLLNAVYGLVSREGSHPNMAPHEHARILRQHAFTVAHFLLLRFENLHPPPRS